MGFDAPAETLPGTEERRGDGNVFSGSCFSERKYGQSAVRFSGFSPALPEKRYGVERNSLLFVEDDEVMRVCAIQMDVVKGDRAANRATVGRMVGEAMKADCPPEVIVLPELWSTGYDLERAGELASPMGGDDASFLGELAVRYHVSFVGGSVLAEKGGRVYNRAQVVDSEGKYVAGYDKIHLFRLMAEDKYLAQGESPLSFSLGGMRCASVICYDIRFCELIRRLAVEGAEVLFVSAEWPLPRSGHWTTLLRARAIENQMYVVACNRCGVTGQEVFAGNSMIIAPDGAVLAHADTGEAVIHAELDPACVRQTRESIPVFQDRVPRLY